MLTQVLEIEEKTIISSLLGSSLCPHIPEVETKERRRRKKARAETASGKTKKRRLSDEQAKFLEMNFGKERKLESRRKVLLATELGLDPEQVAVWFQNRRARWKNKQIEEENTKLKAKHDTVVVEKCHLENEVLKLRERLMEAEEEIKKLSKSLNGASEMGGSPSSSFSTATQHHLLEGFGLEEDTDMLYVNEYNNYMEWVNFNGM